MYICTYVNLCLYMYVIRCKKMHYGESMIEQVSQPRSFLASFSQLVHTFCSFSQSSRKLLAPRALFAVSSLASRIFTQTITHVIYRVQDMPV
jgi:hypothetical protein